MLFGVENLILGKKVEKVIGHSHLTVKLSICKITSSMLRTKWAFKTKEHNEQLFCYREIQSSQYFLQNQSISLHILF